MFDCEMVPSHVSMSLKRRFDVLPIIVRRSLEGKILNYQHPEKLKMSFNSSNSIKLPKGFGDATSFGGIVLATFV